MATKYIVNNLTGQTITGDLTIEGSLLVTGATINSSIASYKALLTQTVSFTGTSLSEFNLGLIKGEVYTISNYVAGDDFSNIANVTLGTINETGCVFIATGSTPTSWTNGSQIVSSGNFIVDVLENGLGYNLNWDWVPMGGYGYYVATREGIILPNQFPKERTQISTQVVQPFDWGFPYINIVPLIYSFSNKDDIIIFNVIDYDISDTTDNALYYTPIEINIKQDLDETPIILSGTVTASFPFYNPSIDIYCGGTYIGPTYYGPGVQVNNLTELVSVLNGDSETNFLGTFAEDGENITLIMKSNLKNQFCPDNTLTFEVFSD